MNGIRSRTIRAAAAGSLALAGVGVVTSAALVQRLRSHTADDLRLAGQLHTVDVDGCTVSYRHHPGHNPTLRPSVFVHGWGWPGDPTWGSVIRHIQGPYVVIDLPGHGRSAHSCAFTFSLAAQAVATVTRAVGFVDAALVAHSMGGPISMLAIRNNPGLYGAFIPIATSAWWVRPRESLILFAAPLLRASHSPWLVSDLVRLAAALPEQAPAFAWGWHNRPNTRTLHQAATELRHFNALDWDPQILPPTTWIVATDDIAIPPNVQRQSALWAGANIIEVDGPHSFFSLDPTAVVDVIADVTAIADVA